MTLHSFQKTLYTLLETQQQNAVADILQKIKNAPYNYNKVLYADIENSMGVISMNLLAHQLVASTKTLISTLTQPQQENSSEYERISRKIETNRGVGTTEILLDKSISDLQERELLRLFQQERVQNELEEIEPNWEAKTVHERLVLLSLGENGHLFKGTFLCIGKQNQVNSLNYTAAETKFTHYKGTDRSLILDLQDVKGGLIQQYEGVIKLLKSHIPLRRDRNTNTDEYEIPMVAIRELVANAFVHRDYSQNVKSFIQIELYDDRLEIKSPGQLPEQLNLANIEGTLLINPTIMAVFHLYGYVEKRGSGIATAQAVLREKGLEVAKIENIAFPPLVKATIYRKTSVNLPKFSVETQKEVVQMYENGELAGIFILLEDAGVNDDTFQRLKQTYIAGEIDMNFMGRLQLYLKNIFPSFGKAKENNTRSILVLELKKLVMKGNISQAITDILAATEGTDLYNDLILLSQRHSSNENENNKGVLASDVYKLERNKISAALLGYIDKLTTLS